MIKLTKNDFTNQLSKLISVVYTIDFFKNKGIYHALYNRYKEDNAFSFDNYKVTIRF